MGLKSYNNGKVFEQQLCEYYSKNGYYVIYNEKGVTGSQCCDIIVIKDNITTLIEAKNLSNKNGIFSFERIEQNQRLAYLKYTSCGNKNFILAIKWNLGVYLIDFGLLDIMTTKSINLKQLEPNFRLEE